MTRDMCLRISSRGAFALSGRGKPSIIIYPGCYPGLFATIGLSGRLRPQTHKCPALNERDIISQVRRTASYMCDIISLEISGLKGQQAISPRQRLGNKDVSKFALKGQKLFFGTMLLPLQGVGCALHLPRALPWAESFLAFQAVFAELEEVKSNNISPERVKAI